ncbi:molybdopterin-dependent oxidoreductase [Agromyces seonyuensis]|uniref:Molybdopterin-dependent oxidoreductase n=1 Tax=Agromyces seonyuensis TaxID=2662446 RepID=A0A6I4P6N2_9MICO|nr:molybdopterin-dependent oxidoreductase [Agromyces seonyuensis]MWC00290.1 molybdopterin-dependent oxidoreductase [Agromyces seonyuensis]
MTAARTGSRGRGAAALSGVAATVFGVGVAELAAGLFGWASPVLAVGALGIDLAPPWAKNTAIAWFGTGDKPALVIGVALVLLGIGALAGLLEVRRPPLGSLIFAAEGVLALAAALTRAGASPFDAIPPILAVGGSLLALRMLLARRPSAEHDPLAASVDPGASRRTFLAFSLGAIAIGAVGAAVGGMRQQATRAVQAAREALRLPTATAPAPSIPTGADLGIDGLAPYVTPNADFYRIDTALVVPDVDPGDWRLEVDGLVDEPFSLDWDELTALPFAEQVTTIACVSNEVGGDLIGNAVWLGVPVRLLLERAGVQGDADMVLSQSIDGFTASTPLSALTDPERAAILAVGMNGEPLPAEHGFPVRMIVPGLYGYVSATKWLTRLHVTRFADATAYWTDRGWSAEGPVKLSSRIDVPRSGASVDAGEVVVAGVAWHPHTGISGVEVRVDGGAWQAAELADVVSEDTWRQWRWRWSADSGDHELEVRATGADGERQSAQSLPPAPDGATGLHRIRVDVR